MKTKPRKIFIPIIDNGGGGVKANWAYSMLAGAFNGLSIHLNRGSDSHADRAMNAAAANFMYSDATHFLCIDCDILFTCADIENLLSHDEPIVNGIYPKKCDDTPPCLQTFPEGPRRYKENLLEVRRCGRGFMLVAREVFEAMKEENGGPALRFHNHGRTEWQFFLSGTLTGGSPMSSLEAQLDDKGFPVREWQSEDWHFFERAKLLGYKCLVDPRIALKHEGDKVFSFSNAQAAPEIREWKDVPGWFSDADAEFYKCLADKLPDFARFVEVGVWRGRSLGAFASFRKNRKTKLYAVDTFQGSETEPCKSIHAKMIAELGGNLRADFERNMKALGINVTIEQLPSVEAAAQFADGILDAVFIDGAHDFASVWSDLEAWYPKIKTGGIIAGHDADLPEVIRAVAKYGTPTIKGNCWYLTR